MADVEPVWQPDAQVYTWYVDHEYTHGVAGLASVSDEATTNLVGVGPDMVFADLTAVQLVKALRAIGFTDLETDVEVLQEAWHDGCPPDGISWHGSRGECQYCGLSVAEPRNRLDEGKE